MQCSQRVQGAHDQNRRSDKTVRLRLRWFESITCHHLRKRPVSCVNAAMRAVSLCPGVCHLVAPWTGVLRSPRTYSGRRPRGWERCAEPAASTNGHGRPWPPACSGLACAAKPGVHPCVSPAAFRFLGQAAGGRPGAGRRRSWSGRASSRRRGPGRPRPVSGRRSRRKGGRWHRQARCGPVQGLLRIFGMRISVGWAKIHFFSAVGARNLPRATC